MKCAIVPNICNDLFNAIQNRITFKWKVLFIYLFIHLLIYLLLIFIYLFLFFCLVVVVVVGGGGAFDMKCSLTHRIMHCLSYWLVLDSCTVIWICDDHWIQSVRHWAHRCLGADQIVSRIWLKWMLPTIAKPHVKRMHTPRHTLSCPPKL